MSDEVVKSTVEALLSTNSLLLLTNSVVLGFCVNIIYFQGYEVLEKNFSYFLLNSAKFFTVLELFLY
jgi:hypothetical protein